jgi:hypothetical protein
VITGGVSAPGVAGLGGELGGGDGVVAEGIGNHGGWHLEDVLADRGAASGDGGDSEFVD